MTCLIYYQLSKYKEELKRMNEGELNEILDKREQKKELEEIEFTRMELISFIPFIIIIGTFFITIFIMEIFFGS